MTMTPPTRNVYCHAISAKIPVPVLVWTEYEKGHFRAEPLPGYVFYVMEDEGGFGWHFLLPGKPVTPCTRRDIATHSCECYWFKAIKTMMNVTTQAATAETA